MCAAEARRVMTRIRQHAGIAAVVVFGIAAGTALLLALVFHQDIGGTSVGILLLVPGAFLAWLAIPDPRAPSPPDLELLVDQLSLTVAEPAMIGVSKCVSLALRPPLLVGRESLLADLRRLLRNGKRPQPRTVVLYGLAGIGKTSLAVEYIHRHMSEVQVAWQLAAEDPSVLAAGMAKLARQLSNRKTGSGPDPVNAVHAALASFPLTWVMLFDNAPDEQSVRPFLPPAGKGQILITSQNSAWSVGHAIAVPVLDIQNSASLLTNRTGCRDQQAAEALAEELGGLPLALEQAAAYVRTTATTLSEYLPLLLNQRAALLARGEVTNHPVTVAATLGLAMSRLDRDFPLGVALLRLLACLAPGDCAAEHLAAPCR